MKIYIKAILLIFGVFASFGIAFPMLISQESDVAVGIGIIGIVFVIPIFLFLIRSIIYDLLRIQDKSIRRK